MEEADKVHKELFDMRKWNKQKKQIISLAFIFFSFVLFTQSVQAKKTIGDAGSALDSAVNPTGLPKGEVATYVGSVAQWIFGALGLTFFVLATYAGITWFIARGEEEKITKAKQTLIAAVIGLIIAISAYAISVFITNTSGFGG